jgi:cell division protein FtsI/penicillin-binding protein 2
VKKPLPYRIFCAALPRLFGNFMPDLKIFRLGAAVLALAVLAGCSQPPTPLPETPTPDIPTPTLPQPQLVVTRAPDAGSAARAYLDAWRQESYETMYAMLSSESRLRIDQETFVRFYEGLTVDAALDGWNYQLYDPVVNPYGARIGYEIILHSVLVGEIHSATEMQLILENGRWQVVWDEGLALPQLRDGNRLQMAYNIPERASIYDRSGAVLAAQGEAYAIGLRTGELNPDQENALLDTIRSATGVHPNTLRPRIEAARGSDWYIPVADVPLAVGDRYFNALTRFPGVRMTRFSGRYYPYGPQSAHAVGYASLIQAEEADQLRRQGYNIYSNKVGRTGIELWAEDILGGQRGGALRLFTADNQLINVLAEAPSRPSQDVTLTFNAAFQAEMQKALGDFRGAIVVLERDTGRVLAMASSPGYNPNLFEPSNFNYSYSINDVFNPATTPRLNRAAEAQYPLGSVFKIISMAAGLYSGFYTAESTYMCDYFFTEMQGVTLTDWTYERFQKDEKTPPSGLLTLPQGLMRSCNPWFYHIGRTLFVQGQGRMVSDMARGFGLGQLTGIEIPEVPGNIPAEAVSELDATNISIGQGDVMVTPLQVAVFMAAMGNGGILYEPHLVERIGPEIAPSYTFTPTVGGELPITAEQRDIINQALRAVVSNSRGTANHILGAFSSSYRVPIYGKTGTSQTGILPHSWFAGFTDAGRENQPDIAVAVLVENVGEGSEYAAPIFKRVMEVYFTGAPRSIFPWESEIGVRRTPTPEPTATPIPTETPVPSPTPEPEG